MAGTKITQLQDIATPGRRFGNFTGRVPGGGGRTVGKITQLQMSAIPGRRFGSFAGRSGGGGGAFWIFGEAILQ